ncbi:MAG: hypothetical protein NTV15_03055 [Candidatus Bathyarchaeota archaeon]|nr:hypothetical protein [Candidatus Bathyarchaeota archaeon]
MPSKKVINLLPQYDPASYHVGINTAFAEVVGMGCKKLSLSSPLTNKEFNDVFEPTKLAFEEYGVQFYVEEDLLSTLLFDVDIAKNLKVIMIAASKEVLDEYFALKEMKKKNLSEKSKEIEMEIARRFGTLLSYDLFTIEKLIGRHL